MTGLNLSMFRAYDIRTPSAQLSDDLAARLARAEGQYFLRSTGARGVLLGHDARTAGPRYLNIAVEEYTRAGLEVVTIPGVSSTSKFYFSAMERPELAGVLIGASHNPAEDTGRKILAPGVRPVARNIGPEGGLDRIKELYIEDTRYPLSTKGKASAHDPMDRYVEYSLKLAGVSPGSLGGLKVFHDYLHGAAGPEMTQAFEAAGAELKPLHSNPDGSFPLGDPNPVKQAVIREGLQRLVASDARLGTFFDGDGDRIDFYAGDGRYLSSSFVYAAILPEIVDRSGGGSVEAFADLKSNPLAIVEMARAGARLSVNRNGHSQIKQSMILNPGLIGGVEESAHYYERFFLDGEGYCTENTLYFALLVSRVWMENPERFERLFEIQARTARKREWGHRFPSDDSREGALRAVRESFISQGAAAIDRTAGGYDLEATLMRRGLPFLIDAETRMAPDWLQVCQRVSQSEDGLARWEVVAATREIAAEAKETIKRIVREYGGGDEYQG